MVYIDAFGLESNEELTEKLLSTTLKRPCRVFAGYNNLYFYRNFGAAEIVVNVTDDAEGKFQIHGGSTHIIGDHVYRMRVEERVSSDDVESIYVCSSLSGRGVTLAMNTVMGDVIPQLQKGDIITFQGIGFLHEDFELCLSQRKAERLFARSQYIPEDGQILSGAPHESIFNLIYAKIRSFNPMPFLEGLALYTAEVFSDFGPLTLVIPPGYLEKHKGIQRALEKGSDVYVSGTFYLSGDVAIDYYNNGAVYDEEHFLRLLRASFEDGNYSRLDKYLSSGLVLEGFPKEGKILSETLDSLIAPYGRESDALSARLYTVRKALQPEKAVYSPGKRLLGVEGRRFSGAFALESENEEITRISLISDNIYQAEADRSEESAEERGLRENPYYSESAEGWYRILSAWSRKDLSCSMKVFYGLDRDVSLFIGERLIQGKEEVYPALQDEVIGKKAMTEEEIKDTVSLGVSLRGLIKEIRVSGLS